MHPYRPNWKGIEASSRKYEQIAGLRRLSKQINPTTDEKDYQKYRLDNQIDEEFSRENMGIRRKPRMPVRDEARKVMVIAHSGFRIYLHSEKNVVWQPYIETSVRKLASYSRDGVALSTNVATIRGHVHETMDEGV